MRRDKSFASVIRVAAATLALAGSLAGCGADDAASNAAPSPSSSSSSGMTAANGDSDSAQRAATLPAAPILDASSTLAAAAIAASDPITQNMQASLAADNRQVAPVMHYAPGDSATSN